MLQLTAANTYTGATAVNAGSLFVGVNGSLAAGSAVTVSGTGTKFGGTGIINGSIAVGSGAILTAGNPAAQASGGATGILTTGTLTLATGSVFNAILTSSSNFSTLNATGTTALAGASFSISLTPGAVFTPGTSLQLISSPISGAFTNTVVSTGGYNFTADYTNINNPGTFYVDVAAVPEPSTWAGLVTLAMLMGGACRRQIVHRLRAARA